MTSVLATFAAVAPCWAIETGQPPNLPPPPPPPLTTATPGASTPAPAPRAAKPAPPPPASSSSPSVTATATTSTADSDSLGSGPHALDTRWFIAPLLGFASDNLNFGVGVRGGKTLDNHLYLGGTFVFQSGEYSISAFYLGPEVGYDFDLRYVVVRPYVGLGLFNASGGGAFAGNSASRFVIWPGCTVIWNVPGSNFFLGGDVRLITLPEVAVGIYAMGGLHFGT